MYRAELINEDTLAVVKTAHAATKEEAIVKVGFHFNLKGFDCNVSFEGPTQLSGCGVHSFYVD